MASLSNEKRNGKQVYRILLFVNENRKAIWLGAVSKRLANEFLNHIGNLETACSTKTGIPKSTIEWLNKIDNRTYSKLSNSNLVPARKLEPETLKYTVTSFIEMYIQNRSDVSTSTVSKWNATKRMLVEYFEETGIDKITAGDADDWQSYISTVKFKTGNRTGEMRYAAATTSKCVKHCKQFFEYAVRKGILKSNPFKHLKASGEQNRERQHFVDRPTIEKIINEIRCPQWRLIVALSRFGALRCPSEVLDLKWSDINSEVGRMKVTSKKTKRHGKGFRILPIFPELEPFILEAHEAAETGSEFVITRYRHKNSNLRTQFLRFIDAAKVESWPRLFHNMRSSRKTELSNEFPAHVVADWTGSSIETDDKHYLQTTDSHFDLAIQKSVAPSVAVPARTAENRGTKKRQNPQKHSEILQNALEGSVQSSPGRTRTSDKAVNSRSLYQLSYRGMFRSNLENRRKLGKPVLEAFFRFRSLKNGSN